MINQQIAARFNEISDQLELANANPFRVRAYRRAAVSLERLKVDISSISQRGQLQNISGIGQELAEKINEFINTGHIPDATPDEIATPKSGGKLPHALLGLISIGALERSTATVIHNRFYMESLDDLEKLAASHLLRTLPGLGPQNEQRLLSGIQQIKSSQTNNPEV